MAKSHRVLWLHTQPEHYVNCMIDDLNAASDLEFIVAYMWDLPPGQLELPRPLHARSLALTEIPGRCDSTRPRLLTSIHRDWRKDLDPLQFDALFLPGYLSAAGSIHREILRDCRHRGIPVAMMSDTNIRCHPGHNCRARLRRRAKALFLNYFTRRVDYVLPANRLGVAYWRYYGVPRRNIVVCPYYADYDRVTRTASIPRAQAFAPFQLDPARKLILTAARLVPAKGLDLMIQAFRASGLAEQGWLYAIAGRGPEEAALKAAAGPDLDRSIRFLGFAQPSVLLPLLRHAALFVLPSRYEPHGIVIQEAMASATPVLASHVCGAAHDLITAGRSGWIFRSDDPVDLRQKLLEAATDPARLDQMRPAIRAAFDRWYARYNPILTIDRVAHHMLDGTPVNP